MEAEAVRAFQEFVLERHGVDPAKRLLEGVTIAPDPDRSGSGTASAYALGDHVAVLCDPGVAERVAAYDPGSGSVDSKLERYMALAPELGAEPVARASMYVLTEPPAPPTIAGVSVVALDRDDGGDVDRLRAFLDACPPADVDEADIYIDDLDPIIRCTELEPGGAITAYASAYCWTDFGDHWDIGVLTHPEHRGHGLGAHVVQALTHELVGRGDTPLYRHDDVNVASARVAAACGFHRATRLAAIRFPNPPVSERSVSA